MRFIVKLTNNNLPMKVSSTRNSLKRKEENKDQEIDSQFYDHLLKVIDQYEIEPSKEVTNNILNFAKSYRVLKSKKIKHIEINMN